MSQIISLPADTPYLERGDRFMETWAKARKAAGDTADVDVRNIGGMRLRVSDAVAKALGSSVQAATAPEPTTAPAKAQPARKAAAPRKSTARKSTKSTAKKAPARKSRAAKKG